MVKFKRGDEATRVSAGTPDDGEPLWDDTGHLFVGFPSTAGGKFVGPNHFLGAYSSSAITFSTDTVVTFNGHGADSGHITHSTSTNTDEFSFIETGRFFIYCQAAIEFTSLSDQVKLRMQRWNGTSWANLVAGESWVSGTSPNDIATVSVSRTQLFNSAVHKLRFVINSNSGSSGCQIKAGAVYASIVRLD